MNNLLAKHEAEYFIEVMGGTWTGIPLSDGICTYVVEPNAPNLDGEGVRLYMRSPRGESYLVEPNIDSDETVWSSPKEK